MHTGTSCFSNPPDVPPVIGNRDAARSAQCGWLHCFSYPADMPMGGEIPDTARLTPSGLRRMAGGTCFRY